MRVRSLTAACDEIRRLKKQKNIDKAMTVDCVETLSIFLEGIRADWLFLEVIFYNGDYVLYKSFSLLVFFHDFPYTCFLLDSSFSDRFHETLHDDTLIYSDCLDTSVCKMSVF